MLSFLSLRAQSIGMTRIIGVLSAKGGVGKTTTAANLSVALANYGRSVIVLDGNVTTPNLSLHLGIPLARTTLHDVLKNRAHISQAIHKHRSGIRIVPASLSVAELRGLDIAKLSAALLNLLGQAEIIIIDGAAGLGREALATMEVADELVIVTNPELPALTDALRAVRLAHESGAKVLGVVLNRVRGHSHELSVEDVNEMLGVPVIAVVPEDPYVPRAIAQKIPVVHFAPSSRAARQFRRLAATVLGKQPEPTKRKG